MIFFARKIEKLAKDTQHVLAKHQLNIYRNWVYWVLLPILGSHDISDAFVSSSKSISMVLFKVIFQIYLKRWNLYKTDTSLRRTLGHSPLVSVLRGSTVGFLNWFAKVSRGAKHFRVSLAYFPAPPKIAFLKKIENKKFRH